MRASLFLIPANSVIAEELINLQNMSELFDDKLKAKIIYHLCIFNM